jgi:hypothetical protein
MPKKNKVIVSKGGFKAEKDEKTLENESIYNKSTPTNKDIVFLVKQILEKED